MVAHAAVLMQDFTVCQQANTSQLVAPTDTYDGQTSMKDALVILLALFEKVYASTQTKWLKE